MAVKEGNSRVIVTLKDELANYIRKRAKENKRTVSNEVAMIIESFLKLEEKE